MSSVSARRGLSLVWLSLLAYGVLFALLQDRLLPPLAWPEGAVLLVSALVASLPALALLLGQGAEPFPRETPRPGQLIYLLGLALTANLAVTALTPLLERLWKVAGFTARAGAGGDDTLTPLLAFYICLAGPLLEELVYRGVLLRRLRTAGTVPALVLSAVCFGIMHHDLYQGLAAFCGGLVYGWAALHYGLRASVVLHVLNNSLAVALPLLRNFGTAGALLTLVVAFGPVAVALVGTLAALRRRRKAGPAAPKTVEEPLRLGQEPLLWALLAFDTVYLISASFTRL